MTRDEALHLAARICDRWPNGRITLSVWTEELIDFPGIDTARMTLAITELARKNDFMPSIAELFAQYTSLGPPPPSHVPRTPDGDVVLAAAGDIDPRFRIADDVRAIGLAKIAEWRTIAEASRDRARDQRRNRGAGPAANRVITHITEPVANFRQAPVAAHELDDAEPVVDYDGAPDYSDIPLHEPPDNYEEAS